MPRPQCQQPDWDRFTTFFGQRHRSTYLDKIVLEIAVIFERSSDITSVRRRVSGMQANTGKFEHGWDAVRFNLGLSGVGGALKVCRRTTVTTSKLKFVR